MCLNEKSSRMCISEETLPFAPSFISMVVGFCPHWIVCSFNNECSGGLNIVVIFDHLAGFAALQEIEDQ
uniref:Uncharacterized protein n=1 Tax=Romanomermis culicivorax TaxID=13658 RepID=A0A915I200_ROMCU